MVNYKISSFLQYLGKDQLNALKNIRKLGFLFFVMLTLYAIYINCVVYNTKAEYLQTHPRLFNKVTVSLCPVFISELALLSLAAANGIISNIDCFAIALRHTVVGGL